MGLYDNSSVGRAIQDLLQDQTTYGRLERYGNKLYPGEGEDLLMEAVTKTLEGRRRAEPENIEQHLFSTIKSRANARWRQVRLHQRELPDLEGLERQRQENAFHEYEVSEHRQARVGFLRRLMQCDSGAMRVLDSLLKDVRPKDLPALLKISNQEYKRARKAIERRIKLLDKFL